jgi:hypothetical protein
MVFNALYEAKKRGELLLIDGGMCHWHLRKDGHITIREIFSTRPGAGVEMIEILKTKGAKSIFAKCPADLPANRWYKKIDFTLEDSSKTKTGRKINHWRLKL